jgi:hypothetical protein
VTTPHGSRAGGFWNDSAVSSHGLLKDIYTGIVVAVHYEATVRAFVDTDREEDILEMSTSRADLRRVGRLDTHHGSRGLFRLREQVREKRRPCRITDTFSQAGILDHVAHHQGLHREQPKAVDQLTRLLLHKVLAPPADALMDARHDLAPLSSLFRAPLCFGQTALGTCEGLLLFSEEPGVLNLIASREVGKGFQPHIDADLALRWGQEIRLHFIAREDYVPFIRGRSGDGGRLAHPFERTMHHKLEMPDFGEEQFALLIEAKAKLRVGQAPVAESGFEAGIARRLTRLKPPEECLEGFVHTMQDILQDLREDTLVFGANLLDLGQLRTLLRERDALVAHPPSIFALLQGGIVQFRAQGELFIQHARLLLGWVDPVAIGFLHTSLFFSGAEKRRRSSIPIPKKGHAFHPHVRKARVLWARELVTTSYIPTALCGGTHRNALLSNMCKRTILPCFLSHQKQKYLFCLAAARRSSPRMYAGAFSRGKVRSFSEQLGLPYQTALVSTLFTEAAQDAPTIHVGEEWTSLL